MPSAEQTWTSMAGEKKIFTEAEVAAVYNELRSIEPDFLLGDWTGGDLDTGHAAHKALESMRWAGKSFRSVDDVDPVMVYDENDKRVWNEKLGHAALREVKFRGVVSVAMIYDNLPIIDHFRYVNDDTVAGAMDTKTYGEGAGVYYFYLTRLKNLIHFITFPPLLPLPLHRLPKLDALQCGHLRHFHNLSAQPDGSWRHMGGADPGQESFDAYRYQLSNMAYAAVLAHYHRLPALRGVFRPLLRSLIRKMLRRDVWGYWFTTSTGGRLLDPGLAELRAPWADPVARENIMHSGHLLLMTSLYAMLFDDGAFERDGSIAFDWDPRFWGLGSERFEYSTGKLQAVVVEEMRRNGYVGACCEPNAVFVICNQFPLIAMRYNDVRNGTAVLDEVLPRYVAAWEEKGMIGPSGQVAAFWMVKQDRTVASDNISSSAWAGAFMNAWNPDLVCSTSERQSRGFVTTIDGETRLQTPAVGSAIRDLVAGDPEKHEYDCTETLAAAIALVKAKMKTSGVDEEREKLPTFGYVVQWLSELGEQSRLAGLLAYADSALRPTWEDGGLFYARCDALRDAHADGWDWTFVDPYTGNTAIGYARLNVRDGQRKMFAEPWTREMLARRPFVEGVDLARGVDFLRGVWVEEELALVATVRSWDGAAHAIAPRVRNLREGRWGVYVRGELQRVEEVVGDAALVVPVEVGGGEEVDVVLLHGESLAVGSGQVKM